MKKKKISKILLILFVFLVSLIGAAYFLFKKSEEGSYIGSRWVKGKTQVYRVGGGYMYPTLAWCLHYGGLEDCSKVADEESFRLAPELILRDDNFKPQRGMIVAFKNRGGIDRIIGLPNEKIIFNNGYVYVNGNLCRNRM